MKKKRFPYIFRLARLAIKCTWYALSNPGDPYYKSDREVNFWNIPIRRKANHCI